MISENDQDALRRLSKSLLRFDPSILERIIQLLDQEGTRFESLEFLRKSIAEARAKRLKKPRGDTQTIIRKRLLSSSIEPARRDILIPFFEELFSKSILPTGRDIRAFIVDNGF